jgi:hypothetical protein
MSFAYSVVRRGRIAICTELEEDLRLSQAELGLNSWVSFPRTHSCTL